MVCCCQPTCGIPAVWPESPCYCGTWTMTSLLGVSSASLSLMPIWSQLWVAWGLGLPHWCQPCPQTPASTGIVLFIPGSWIRPWWEQSFLSKSAEWINVSDSESGVRDLERERACQSDVQGEATRAPWGPGARGMVEAQGLIYSLHRLNKPSPKSPHTVGYLTSCLIVRVWKMWEENKRSELRGAGAVSPKGRVQSWPWCWSQGSRPPKGSVEWSLQ